MAQVLIVSNRLPVTVKKVDGVLEFSSSMGGVATGLSSYIKNRKNKWVGWPGIAADELTENEKHLITVELAKSNCAPVFLSRKQLEDFYNGYSNSLLWPLFHNLKMGGKPVDHDRWWRAYRSVNKAYAQAVNNLALPRSTIWVHDYQLMLLPEMLRAEWPTNHIGFFLHIPFPEDKTFVKLPEATRLLKGILGADLVGFHTKGYVRNFLHAAQVHELGSAGDNQLILNDRTVQVTDFPMGIDYEKFTQAKNLPVVKKATKELKRKYKGQKIIAGVDRLDITKGFVERLQAYRDFLAQNPRQHGKVVFVLVGAPSRGEIDAYKKLSKKVATSVAAINQEFGTAKWQPVDYNDQGLPFEEVTALFQVADVAFVAPLRDGMNLVAKEFIASKRKNGILILSDTAGAAQELQDALLVDHKKPATLVAALEQAMSMRRREIRGRFKRMQKHLALHTVHTWSSDFIKALQKPVPGTPRLLTRSLSPNLQRAMRDQYRRAANRLILLDYDGTLVPFSSDYDDSKVPAPLFKILQKLQADPANEVVIVSGRSADDLDQRFGGLKINLVAEHGAMSKHAGAKNWHTLSRAESRWKRQIKPVLEKYADLTPRARVEEKPHSLVWHYRQSPPYYAQKYSVVLKRVLKPVLKAYGLAVFQGNKILEIKNPNITKGTAVLRWVSREHDFVLALGDDYTDEDMFTALDQSNYTIKVRAGRTAAKYRLAGHREVGDFLKRLTR